MAFYNILFLTMKWSCPPIIGEDLSDIVRSEYLKEYVSPSSFDKCYGQLRNFVHEYLIELYLAAILMGVSTRNGNMFMGTLQN